MLGKDKVPALLLSSEPGECSATTPWTLTHTQCKCSPQLPSHSTNPSSLLLCTGILCKGLQQKSWLRWSGGEGEEGRTQGRDVRRGRRGETTVQDLCLYCLLEDSVLVTMKTLSIERKENGFFPSKSAEYPLQHRSPSSHWHSSAGPQQSTSTGGH